MSFCHIKVAANQIVQIDIPTKVNFASKLSDPGDEFDVGTHRFTCKVAGDYLFFCRIYWRKIEGEHWSENQYDKVTVKVNDVEEASHTTWHTTVFEGNDTRLSDLIQLSVDDTISVSVQQNSIFEKTVGPKSDLTIKLLS